MSLSYAAGDSTQWGNKKIELNYYNKAFIKFVDYTQFTKWI